MGYCDEQQADERTSGASDDNREGVPFVHAATLTYGALLACLSCGFRWS
jgi:hypothetical protein